MTIIVNNSNETAETWLTAKELAEFGYRPQALVQLFGEPKEGPAGITGWSDQTVTNIEHTVLYPAARLLESSFRDQTVIENMVQRVEMDGPIAVESAPSTT